jgi:NitT/TauT family transport system substrate-binding protein
VISVRPKTLARLLASVSVALWLIASAVECGSAFGASSSDGSGSAAGTVRLGYFANITHATPLIGIARDYYAQALGSRTTLSTQVYNAGPAEMTALLGGQLDAAYVGPSSALNAFVQSHGESLRIVAGATTGGAELVVKSAITSAAQLKGKTIATPQKGNTQDVALRYWLKTQGLTANPDGTGDVSVDPQDNAATLDQFKAGRIDGAWVPEPWASRLVTEAGARVLVDEKSLWPGGDFATTNLVVSTTFLKDHPQTVKALIDGQLAANAWIAANPADAQAAVNAEIKRLTGKALSADETARAFTEQAVTDDPLASTLQAASDHAVAVGLLKKTDLKGIYDLSILDTELAAKSKTAVADAGLGQK